MLLEWFSFIYKKVLGLRDLWTNYYDHGAGGS